MFGSAVGICFGVAQHVGFGESNLRVSGGSRGVIVAILVELFAVDVKVVGPPILARFGPKLLESTNALPITKARFAPIITSRRQSDICAKL